ncbi:MAG: serine hydrolase domain-containing protein [Cyanobacteria bacterium P01_C01_bin.118]
MVRDIEDGEFPNTHALLIEHNGTLVFERYFSGSDERWGKSIGERVMDPNSLHDIRSISKSVTSILLEIALADRLDSAVNRSVAEYLPTLNVPLQQQVITLHHLLTMTSRQCIERSSRSIH